MFIPDIVPLKIRNLKNEIETIKSENSRTENYNI